MASSKTGRDALPKRFRPLFDQAMTQAELRYGAPEAALGTVLAQLTREYNRGTAAQTSANQTVLGALQGADQRLNQTYTDAGLTPELRAQIGNSPTGQRLAGELASNRADVQSQQLGQQQGHQYLLDKLRSDFGDDLDALSSQGMAMAKERGLFTDSLLGELISADRAARSAANAAARKQAADEAQAALDRATSTGNALIGQGITPIIGEDGSVSLGPALPGGKADPNANKPKTNRATNSERKSFATDFSKALGLAQKAITGPQDKRSKSHRRATGQDIMNGYEGSGGETIRDTRQTIKQNGRDVPNPNYGKPLLNPDGTEQKTERIEGLDPIANQVAVQAALDIAYDGALSRETVKKLHALGIKTTDLGSVKTQTQLAKERKKKPKYTLPTSNRPVMADSRDQQPG